MSVFRGAGGGGNGGGGGGGIATDVDAVLKDSAGKEINLGPPVSLGRYTLTVDQSGADNTLAALLQAGGGTATTLSEAIEMGLSALLVTVEVADVRVAFDATDPSATGLLYGKGNTQPYVWDCADFTKVRIAGQAASATLRVHLFK